MRRSTRLVCAVGLAMSMFAPMALAAPPVLDRVPGNAVGVVVVPSIARFHKNADAFAKAVETPMPIPEIEEMMESMGVPENKAFDPHKAAAAVAFVPPKAGAPAAVGEEEAEPGDMVVYILPVSSYAEFLAGYEIKPGAAGGIDSGAVNGETKFFKDVGGGFVAMTSTKEPLERAQWNDADAAKRRALIGKTGDAVVDSSDLSWIVFTQEAKQFLPELEKAMEEQMANNPGGEAIGQIKDSPIGKFLTGPVMEDSTANVTGFRFDAQGLSVDNAVAFKEGSETAKKISGVTGSSRQLFSKLPAQPYLMAMAADLSSPGARRLVDEVIAMGGEQMRTGIGGFLAGTLKNSDGAAVVIGMPNGGLMTGLFTSTIAYVKTSNADAFVKSMQAGLKEIDGKAMNGLALETSYTADGGDVEGTKVDTWGIKIKPDENSDEDPGQMAMAIPMIFGQTGGPAGYVARTNGGLYQTLGRNQSLMSSAVKVGNGGENFVADKVIAKVSEQMPKNTIAEMYIGVKSILESAIPLMGMMGVNIDAEIPPSLPPVGLGIAGGDQAVHFGMYVPAQTLKTVVAIVMEAQAAQMAGEEEEPAPGKKNDAKKGAGQPRF